MSLIRYTWAIILMAIMLLAGSCGNRTEKPNILLILADDVGREMFSSYGGSSYHTPNIDELASNSMRLEHFYAAPVCHPARITLMTGRYPFRFGAPIWGSFPKQAENQTYAKCGFKAEAPLSPAG